MHPSISADGRYVAFVSSANNLVASDSNNSADIFVRDRQSNTTIRASRDATPAARPSAAGLAASRPDISANGQFVAFLSFAANLVPVGHQRHGRRVRTRHRQQHDRARLGRDRRHARHRTAIRTADKPSISADGRYVAFASTMINLVAGDTNDARDIFRHDRQTGTTDPRVGVHRRRPDAEPAGRRTARRSRPTAGTSRSTRSRRIWYGRHELLYDVFVRDVNTSTTTRVSLVNQGGPPEAFAWAQSVAPSISADGRYVAFTSGAEDLVAGDDNGWQDVFVHDRHDGYHQARLDLVRRRAGRFPRGRSPDISGDGLVVAYRRLLGTIVAGDGNFADDVFVADWRFDLGAAERRPDAERRFRDRRDRAGCSSPRPT